MSGPEADAVVRVMRWSALNDNRSSSLPGVGNKMGFISRYDLAALREEFGKLFAKPSNDLLRVFRTVVETADRERVVPFQLGWIAKTLGTWTEEKLLDHAAWFWLEPRENPSTLDDLDLLQQALRLPTIPTQHFAEQLIQHAQTMARRSERLSRHCDVRLADLEFLTKGGTRGAGIRLLAFEPLLRTMLLATYQCAENPAAAQQTASRASEFALAVITTIVRDTLAPKEAGGPTEGDNPRYSLNANLMVPVRYGQGDVSLCVGPSLAATKAFDAACHVWDTREPRDCERILVVVAESYLAQYRGFWIPDWRQDGEYFPGAPRAFNRGEADTVCKDDLPPLVGFAKDLERRWHDYMKRVFGQRLFVSIPVFSVPSPDYPKPVAVVNVNVDSDKHWPRAESKPWHAKVTREIAPFAAMAWHTYGVECASLLALGGGNNPPPAVPKLETAPEIYESKITDSFRQLPRGDDDAK